MAVDNDLYDRMSDTWWDQEGFLNILQSANLVGSIRPERFGDVLDFEHHLKSRETLPRSRLGRMSAANTKSAVRSVMTSS